MTHPRRHFLKGLAAAGGLAGLAGLGGGIVPRPVLAAARWRPTADPFSLGVASGSPTDHSVVLWTRLFQDQLLTDATVPDDDLAVAYEVAADERFRRIVARGTARAEARFAHSVHQVVTGLEPAREYWYRFIAGTHRSRVGRTRTLPAMGATAGDFRLAVASCQHYEHAHYAAWRHLAATPPDLVLHLGDYIYEGAPTANRVRRHTDAECRTLAQYRARYAQYQHDVSLQAAHAAAPWCAVWDDHEVANDYSGPYSGRSEDPAAFLARRAAAYQAWYEHLPVPPSMAPDATGAMRIHARLRIGRLATLHLLDQRQYRSAQACPRPGRAGGNRIGDDCAERLDAARTMLGGEQERWLANGFVEAPAAWTLLGQGTMFTQLDEQPGSGNTYWSDAWTGYPVARQRLLDALRDTRARNPVVFSGDLHAFVAAGVHAVPEQPDSPLAAAEFVTTSISSDPRPQDSLDAWRANNPHIQLLEGRARGYLDVRLGERRLQADLVTVEDPASPDSPARVLRSYVVEAGSPVILPA